MSQCFRNVSHKFTTVNTHFVPRKHLAQFDRQLPIQTKLSNFLEEFLNKRPITSVATISKHKSEIAYDACCSVAAVRNVWGKTRHVNSNKTKVCKIPNPVTASSTYDFTKFNFPQHEKSIGRHSGGQKFGSPNHKQEIYLRLSSGLDIIRPTDFTALNCVEKNNRTRLDDGILKLEKVESKETPSNIPGRPTNEQLDHVFKTLKRTLPELFFEAMDYTIYSQDILFVNNIRGTETRGLLNYVKQIALLRTLGHLRFGYVRMELLKITLHPEDDTIKVRWRICGISGFKMILMFWKFNVFKWSQNQEQQVIWYDGFSTFYVGGDGLVYKHQADKVMPDQNETQTTKAQPEVEAKLALFAGLLFPLESLTNIYPLNYAKNTCNTVKLLASKICKHTPRVKSASFVEPQ